MTDHATNLPNFLHVGAAKCGTTSQYFYLRQHPEIFMSPKKGPEFFASGFPGGFGNGPGDGRKPVVTDRSEYLSLFEGAGNARIIGESSVSYLYHHRHAIPLIRQHLGDPRILITLRNPADLAFAYYQHLKRQKRENLSFEAALEAEPKRIRDGWHYHWHYRQTGFFADQVAAYRDRFSRVKVTLLEDLEADPLQYMRELFAFLDVDETFTPDVSTKFNRSGIPRSRLLYRLIFRGGKTRPPAVRWTGKLLGEDRVLSWRQRVRGRMLKRETPAPVTRARLLRDFRPDIEKLEGLLDRDLSGWLREHE